VKIACAHCGKERDIPNGWAKRSIAKGMKLYCTRKCSGLGRRLNLTDAQKKAMKREYDMQYRAKNREMLRRKKQDYFQRTYDPAKAAAERKLKMPRHIEYCRRPEYRAWKKQYDRKYCAAQQYGDFAEAALILRDIEGEIDSRMTRYEVYQAKGTLNKHQQRRREYDRLCVNGN
jgi:hypothetical protein